MRDLFPDGAEVSKELLRRHLSGPVANVQGFGARGDGVSDDTPAIQAAIRHVEAKGGGVVHIPAGTYRIMPQRSIAGSSWPEASALVIAGDNVTIVGDGPALTRLKYRTLNGKDPTDGFERVAWRQAGIWRGTAIYILGGAGEGDARRNTVIANLDLDGGAYPGNTREPGADLPAGPEQGWDISHKGIMLDADKYVSGITLRNLHLHNFRGELIYGGGGHIDSVLIEDCYIYASVADGISITASQVIRNNRIEDIGHSCVESFHFEKDARYTGNHFARAKYGINLQTSWYARTPTQISENVFTDCEEMGILLNVENGPTFITNNLMIDCGYRYPLSSCIGIGPGDATGSPNITGVVIMGNKMLRKTQKGGMGIAIHCPRQGILRSVLIDGNFIGSDIDSFAGGMKFLAPIAYGFDRGATVGGILIRRNVYFGTQRNVENINEEKRDASGPMPHMADNEIIDMSDHANSSIRTDGVTPNRMENDGPVNIEAAEPGTDPTPVFVPEDYVDGQEFSLVSGDATRRVYFPQHSELFTCAEGRYLLPGVELRLRLSSGRFLEVGYRDARARAFAEVRESGVLEFDGFHDCYLMTAEESTFRRFSGVGHGARVRVIGGPVACTIEHGEGIRLRGEVDVTVTEGEVVEFFRTRDGILRQI